MKNVQNPKWKSFIIKMYSKWFENTFWTQIYFLEPKLKILKRFWTHKHIFDAKHVGPKITKFRWKLKLYKFSTEMISSTQRENVHFHYTRLLNKKPLINKTPPCLRDFFGKWSVRSAGKFLRFYSVKCDFRPQKIFHLIIPPPPCLRSKIFWG